jgi:hypothetical protein
MNKMKDITSDKMLDLLKDVAYNQDNYGIDKYKIALSHTHGYHQISSRRFSKRGFMGFAIGTNH